MGRIIDSVLTLRPWSSRFSSICRWMKRARRSSRLSRCSTSSHRYAVRYVRPSESGGFPAAPPQPLLKGRKRVAVPASRVVMSTASVSTAKCTNVRRLNSKTGSRGSRSSLYCRRASSTRCPVSGFFNSNVATGIPFRLSVTSSDCSERGEKSEAVGSAPDDSRRSGLRAPDSTRVPP